MKNRYYDEWERPKYRRRQIVKYVLIMFSAVVFLLVCLVVYLSSMDFPEHTQSSLNLSPTPVPTLIPEATEEPPVDIYAPLADAMGQNADTVAWIKIEGTLINYPVVKANNNKYYMQNGYDKNLNSAGAIFLDKDSDLAGVHLVVYGKVMEDGSRFTELLKYKKEYYIKKNNMITLDTITGKEQYQIFAAYQQPEDFNCLQVDFDTVELWREHVRMCASLSIYKGDYGDGWGRVLTLVAVDEESGENFIVQAGLIS